MEKIDSEMTFNGSFCWRLKGEVNEDRALARDLGRQASADHGRTCKLCGRSHLVRASNNRSSVRGPLLPSHDRSVRGSYRIIPDYPPVLPDGRRASEGIRDSFRRGN